MEPGSPAGAGAEAPAFYSERKLSRKQLKKLAKAEREYEEERRKELEAAQAVDTAQKRELARIESILRTHALRMEYVEPDGHCLFRALVRQLRPLIQSGLFDTYFPAADTETRSALLTWSTIPDEMEAVWLLRKTLASFIRRRGTEFFHFIVGELDPQGTLLDAIDDPAERVAQYCARLEDGTLWGGQPELQAVALALRCRVFVFADPEILPNGMLVMGADDASTDTGAESVTALRVSFHKQFFSLGEHYHAVVPADDSHGDARDPRISAS